MPCSHGKVCNWDTVKDTVRIRMNRAEKTTSQACAETNSLNSKESHPMLSDKKELKQSRNPRIPESGHRYKWEKGMGK